MKKVELFRDSEVMQIWKKIGHKADGCKNRGVLIIVAWIKVA